MPERNSREIKRAKDYAFLLLKFRPRAEAELIMRLRKKKFSGEAINQTISDLKEKRFIDDENFAKGWVESRIKIPLGLNRLKIELKTKGIQDEIISRVLTQAKQQYDQSETVNQLAKERFSRLKNLDPSKAKRRIYAFFLRRGFPRDIVIDAINQL